MKKVFNYLMCVVILVGMITMLAFENATAQYKQRVLIEDHTGAWCGFCPRGMVTGDSLEKVFGDKVICAKLHNGDNMAIAEESETGSAMGLTGYPTGSVNRIVWPYSDGTYHIFLDDANWGQAAAAALKSTLEAGITTSYNYNSSTRELSITVGVEFLVDVTGEVRLNATVLEDSVTGKGTGWDQHNYFSKDRGANSYGWPGFKYYNSPDPMVGFMHMEVCRGFLGGSWGLAGTVTSTTAGSKSSYTFKTTLPAGINANHIGIVGIVQKYDAANAGNCTIMNVIRGTKINPSISYTTTGAAVQIKGKSEDGQLTVHLKNITASDIIYNWTLTKSARTPADWSETCDAPGELTIPANSTVDVVVKLTPGQTVGFGDITLNMQSKVNPLTNLVVNEKITVASSEIENCYVDGGAGTQYSLVASMAAGGYSNYINGTAADFAGGATYPNLKTMVWACGQDGGLTSATAAGITSAINNGANVFLSGELLIASANQNAASFLGTLGASYVGRCWQGEGTGNVTFAGVANDSITNGFKQAGKIYYYTNQIKIANANICKPILKFFNIDTIVGVRSFVNGSRVVCMGINPNDITNATARQDLIKKTMDWLTNSTGAPKGPQIEFDAQDISFSKVALGASKDTVVTITNTGGQPLNILSFTFDATYDPDGVFTITSGGTTPVTLQPNDKLSLVITFTPKTAKGYVGNLTIASNSTTDNNYIISLDGQGDNSNVGAKISSTTTNLDFGTVSTKSLTKSFSISNDGGKALTITNVKIDNDADGVFTIIDGDQPTVLSPKGTETITVKFTPKALKSYTGEVTITSDATNATTYIINLLAVGNVSVPSEISSTDGIVTIKATPNPVTSNGVIQYTINTTNEALLHLYLVDLTGKTISDLLTQNVQPGSSSIEFNTSKLNSGTYYIIANVNGSTAKLPVVVVK